MYRFYAGLMFFADVAVYFFFASKILPRSGHMYCPARVLGVLLRFII
jgi:hypothetical protein